MPRPRLARKKAHVHVYIDEELWYFFKFFLISPTEGRVKQGFGALVERLLREERDRIVKSTTTEVGDAGTGPGHSSGTEQPDGGHSGGLDADTLERYERGLDG